MGNSGASIKNTFDYHKDTPLSEQLSDAIDVLSNPDSWSRASATAGEMYLAGKAMKSLGKSKVKSGGNKAGIKGAKASSNSKTAATKTDFYVTPSGEAIPSTGYRYFARKPQTVLSTRKGILPAKQNMYFSFDKIDDAIVAQGKLQIPYRPEYRASFDTLQIIDDIKIPYGQWGQANYLEPLTRSFPQFGPGKATHAITNQQLSVQDLFILY